MSDNREIFFSADGFVAMHHDASITRLWIERSTIWLPITFLVSMGTRSVRMSTITYPNGKDICVFSKQRWTNYSPFVFGLFEVWVREQEEHFLQLKLKRNFHIKNQHSK